ncbi:MAG: DmsC/YnfH family molybdoenzyme membrane anchor subunit [Dehalococcoidia bacterium]
MVAGYSTLLKAHPPIMTLGYRDQRVWGTKIAIALFAGGTGAGAYFMSKILYATGTISLSTAAISGWIELVLAATGILFLTAHLGRPLRAWRAVGRPHAAWISRGAIVPPAFILFVFLSLLPSIEALDGLPWREESGAWQAIVIVAMILGMGYILYTGMVISTWSSIPFWNTPLIPLLFTTASLLAGTGITQIVLAVRDLRSPVMDLIVVGFIIGNGLLLAMLIVDAYTREVTVLQSMRRFLGLHGGAAFWVGIVLVGLVLPGVLVLVDYWGNIAGVGGRIVLVVVGVSILIGGLMQRYCVLKSGRYRLPI